MPCLALLDLGGIGYPPPSKRPAVRMLAFDVRFDEMIASVPFRILSIVSSFQQKASIILILEFTSFSLDGGVRTFQCSANID